MKHINPSILFTLILVAYSLGAFSQLKVVEYKLSNGLTVILNPDKTVNNVFGAVAVNTGSKNDPIDATGISHYLEHLLFKGTDKLGTHNFEAEKVHLDSINYYYDLLGKTTDKEERARIQLLINKQSIEASKYAMPNEFDKLLKEMGSTGINATTSRDLTWYFNSFPSHQINKWLDLYAHRFTNPIFRSFQSELEVVYEEKNRARDNMQRRLFTAFDKNFYKGHPYGEKGTLGTIEHLKNPSLTKMYEYYNKYYVVNNMALILSGNFDIAKVKPQIEKLFGSFKKGSIPANKINDAIAFKGREVNKARITPIKVGLLGFRTVPRYHPDELIIDVIANLLQNEAGTGFIDQLQIDNKLMGAWAFQSNENEEGQMMFIFIPKIFIQSFKSAENLVLNELEKIKTGDFSEKQLQIVKNELYNSYQSGLEGTRYRSSLFAKMFTAGKSWKDISDYPERLRLISKEEIQEVAQKYFGKDYMLLQSKTGFAKNKKLEKPEFKAVQVDQSKESEYAKYLREKEEIELEPRFIDFEKDLEIINLKYKNDLYVVKNPINDLYNISIRYKVGKLSEPQLEVLAEVMFHAYPQGSTRNEFKDEIGLLGSTYSFSTDNSSYFTLNISGIEKNMSKVLGKINNLMQNAMIDEESIKVIQNSYKTFYKAEKKDPSTIPQALAQLGLVGKQSTYLSRPSLKQIKQITASSLLNVLDTITQYAASIHFTGKTDAESFKKILQEQYTLSSTSKSKVPYKLDPPNRVENEIVILSNKKKLQTSMYFIKEAPQFKMEQYPKMKMFNSYFGGGFSGLITQEIREYRSLAYSTAAGYRYRANPDANSFFYTFIACQADKTNQAVKVAFDLINDMPKKEDRIDLIRSSVKLSQFSNFPNFRNLSMRVESYILKGFERDPNEINYHMYDSLEFEDLYEFYQKNIQNTPTFLGLYGDSKRLNISELEKFGKVKVLKMSDVIKF